MVSNPIQAAIEESIATKQLLAERCMVDIKALCEAAVRCLRRGGKLMFCGNGGSSCDAAHAAGELVGWFEDRDRAGLAAIALGHEIPALTAVANDVGFEQVFARQVEALGKKEDLLVAISTSGSSANVVRAMETARRLGIETAALGSARGGPVLDLAQVAVRVPSKNTARIQESHLLCVHILCAAVEAALATPPRQS